MPSSDPSSSQPLLQDESSHHSTNDSQPSSSRFKVYYSTCKLQIRTFLSSHAQHYTVLGLVSFDLLGIFADIIINLYQCDGRDTDPIWDHVRNGLGVAGLVFSCLFMLELMLSVWAFGWRYFNSKFHVFDALVILASFIVDVLLHGILEEVASLVIILRLWRFFKIIEEFSVGAEEQMDGLELRIEQLESENAILKRELKKQKGSLDEEEGMGFQGERQVPGGSRN